MAREAYEVVIKLKDILHRVQGDLHTFNRIVEGLKNTDLANTKDAEDLLKNLSEEFSALSEHVDEVVYDAEENLDLLYDFAAKKF